MTSSVGGTGLGASDGDAPVTKYAAVQLALLSSNLIIRGINRYYRIFCSPFPASYSYSLPSNETSIILTGAMAQAVLSLRLTVQCSARMSLCNPTVRRTQVHGQ